MKKWAWSLEMWKMVGMTSKASIHYLLINEPGSNFILDCLEINKTSNDLLGLCDF